MAADPAALFAAHQHRLFNYFCRAVGQAETGNPSDSSNGPGRSVESVIQMKPGEIVEIRLPKLGESAGPFGNRDLSIRIRARQLR